MIFDWRNEFLIGPTEGYWNFSKWHLDRFQNECALRHKRVETLFVLCGPMITKRRFVDQPDRQYEKD